MGRPYPRASELCHCDDCCVIRRNVGRPAAPRPSFQTVRNEWNGPRRGRLGRTVEAAVEWLRGVLRDTVRAAVYAVEEHPVATAALCLFVIGGAYIVAPAATLGLLKAAATALTAQLGHHRHHQVLSRHE
jgi:hypothetical protein